MIHKESSSREPLDTHLNTMAENEGFSVPPLMR